MLTFRSGGWVLLLAVVIVGAIAAWRISVIIATYDQRAIGDGVTLESYRFDLDNLLVPRERLRPISRSLRRDGLPVMNDPAKIPAEQFEKDIPKLGEMRKLLPDDYVIGVTINGESVAYPTWILDWHEIVNDTVGGRPILVTYSGVCASAVVFDRTIAGRIRRFGFSGLIYNSNLVMYDYAGDDDDAHVPSLWSQLQMRAISGPLAGTSLEPLPAQLIEWRDWHAAHPETTVLLPEPHRKRVYKRKAYSTYLRDDTLKFPVDPLPGDGRPYKTRIVAVRQAPGDWQVLTRDEYRADPTLAALPQAHSFWFAWYACRAQ